MRIRNLFMSGMLAGLLLATNVSPTAYASTPATSSTRISTSLYNSLNKYLRTHYSNEHISNLSVYHSITMGQYVFAFVTYHANTASLFGTVVANRISRNQTSIINFASSMPTPKSTKPLPFENLESGGTLGSNHQTYFMVGGHVNDPAIRTIRVSFNLKDFGSNSVVQIPVSKEGLYFIFSKDAQGASSVTGYDKKRNVVYKLGM